MKEFSQKAIEILNLSGLKKTEQRLFVIEELLKSKHPISVGDLLLVLKKNGIDKTTIYRTLEFLEKKGLVKSVHTGTREMKYEISDHTNDHHHVICLTCNKVSDFTGCGADSLIENALRQVKDFKSIAYHSFDLFGVCNSCVKNNAN